MNGQFLVNSIKSRGAFGPDSGVSGYRLAATADIPSYKTSLFMKGSPPVKVMSKVPQLPTIATKFLILSFANAIDSSLCSVGL